MTAATRRALTRLRARLPGIVLEVAALAALAAALVWAGLNVGRFV